MSFLLLFVKRLKFQLERFPVLEDGEYWIVWILILFLCLDVLFFFSPDSSYLEESQQRRARGELQVSFAPSSLKQRLSINDAMSLRYYAIREEFQEAPIGVFTSDLLPQGTTLAGRINIHAPSVLFYQQSDRDGIDEVGDEIFLGCQNDEMILRQFLVLLYHECPIMRRSWVFGGSNVSYGRRKLISVFSQTPRRRWDEREGTRRAVESCPAFRLNLWRIYWRKAASQPLSFLSPISVFASVCILTAAAVWTTSYSRSHWTV